MGSNIRQSLRAFFSQALVTFPAIYMVHDAAVSASKVEGESMQPTLNPGGPRSSSDFVLLNKLRDKYGRGDVVVFKSPRDPSLLMIKRIIGVEGDRVRTLPRCNDDYVSVPKGHVWVEGDHHHSFDSSHFGPIPVALIQAHASHIVWPPSRWSTIDSKYPAERIKQGRRARIN